MLLGVPMAGGEFARWLTDCSIDVAQDMVRRDTPLWNAIFDICAVAGRSALRDATVDDLWISPHPHVAYDDLHRMLHAYTGLTLPRRLFDAAWRLYEEGYTGDPVGLNGEWHLRDLAQRMVGHMGVGARTEWTVSEAAASFSRKRYGDDSDDPADDLLPGFANWLDAEAPLTLSHGDVPTGSPLWNAICDLRAAMIHDLRFGGDSCMDDWVTEPGIRHRAPESLASFGILLPPALFEQVWKLYRDAPPVQRRDRGWADQRLAMMQNDSRIFGPQQASNRRYGTDPTPP